MFGETALVMLVIGSAVVAQLALSDAFYLFHRNFWLDEILMDTLVSDRDLGHALRAVRGGLDTNPPTYCLLLRAFRVLAGCGGEVPLRCVALTAALLTLLGLYLSLRQAYPPLTAFAAVLALWGHPLLQRHAFDARMYGLWLAAVVWFAYSLAGVWGAPDSRWLLVLLAGTSFLACTLHTMGIVAWALVVGFHLLWHGFSAGRWHVLGLAGLGPLGYFAWSPFLWLQGRAYYTVRWVLPPSWQHAVHLARFLLSRRLPNAVLLGGGLALFLVPTGMAGTPPALPRNPANLAGLAGLVCMPLVLVVLSHSVDPLLNDRYALPTVASFAPAIALVFSPVPDLWSLALCGLLFWTGAAGLRDLCLSYQEQDQRSARLMAAIRAHTGDAPILFEEPEELHVVCRYAPDLAQRCWALDFEPEHLGSIDNYRLGVRDMVRLFVKFYPRPGLLSWEAVRHAPQHYFVPASANHQQGFADAEKRYPGFTAWPIEAGLYELVATRHGP